MNSSSSVPLTVQLHTVSRSDRWQVYQRLQSLDISCFCSTAGWVEVEVHTPVVVAQLRSVVQQTTASRQELIDWLERCLQIAL